MARRRPHPVMIAVVGLMAACGGPASGASLGAVPTATAQVVRIDIVSTQRLTGTLTFAGSYTVTNQAGPGIYTKLPAPGTLVSRGQSLYEVNDRPVPLLYGAPAWRRLQVGVADGADVRQLEENLLTLGFANASNLVANGHFNWSDASAVRRWQASLGVLQTGIVNLGDAYYLSGPVRIGVVHPSVGMNAQPGQTVLEGTTAQRVVLVAVDVSRQHLVRVGDPVTVALPGGGNTAGTISAIGAIATMAPNTNGSSNGSSPAPTITVSVALNDPLAGAGLEQAPVGVDVIDAMHHGVLAVPVTALLAQPGGSYAVTVISGSQRRTVSVTPGLYDDRGLVEVTSPNLFDGMTVEVPKT